MGPGICLLCHAAEETVSHLFSRCPFWKRLQELLCEQFHISLPTVYDSFTIFLAFWINSHARSSPIFFLPHHTIWALWKARNRALFDGQKPTVSGIFYQIINSAYLLLSRPPSSKQTGKKERRIGHTPNMVYPCGFFDGASTSSAAGIGFCLYLNNHHHLDCALGVGHGTNTKAELLGLWALLFTSQMMGVPLTHVYGDSQVIINWAKSLSALTPPDLHHWCRETQKLITSFPGLTLSHIYREHNRIADSLSKTALSLALGIGCFTEFIDDHLVTSDTIQLF